MSAYATPWKSKWWSEAATQGTAIFAATGQHLKSSTQGDYQVCSIAANAIAAPAATAASSDGKAGEGAAEPTSLGVILGAAALAVGVVVLIVQMVICFRSRSGSAANTGGGVQMNSNPMR